MAHGLAVDLTEENRYSIEIGDCDHPVSYHESVETAKWILKKIPLTQLIEVAMAANKSHCADDAFTYQDGELIQALDALKQTGKAEWL